MPEAINSDATSADLVTLRVTPAQIEQLLALGALSAEQAAAGRAAGGLEIKVQAAWLTKFQQELESEAVPAADELEKLAQQIAAAGMSGPARLFLSAGRPLSFFGSQLLLLAQPATQLAFGAKDPTGRLSQLLEDRRNVDKLLAYLEKQSDSTSKSKSKSDKKREE